MKRLIPILGLILLIGVTPLTTTTRAQTPLYSISENEIYSFYFPPGMMVGIIGWNHNWSTIERGWNNFTVVLSVADNTTDFYGSWWILPNITFTIAASITITGGTIENVTISTTEYVNPMNTSITYPCWNVTGDVFIPATNPPAPMRSAMQIPDNHTMEIPMAYEEPTEPPPPPPTLPWWLLPTIAGFVGALFLVCICWVCVKRRQTSQ